MALDDDLISFWDLNETGALAARVDAHGSNDLTPRGTGVTGLPGLIDNAANHNQNGLEAANSTPFRFGDSDFTIVTWVNATTWSGGSSPQRLIATKWVSPNREWMIDWSNSVDRIRFLARNSADTGQTIVQADTFGAVSGQTSTWLMIMAYHDSVNDEIGISINDGTVDTLAHVGGIQTINQGAKAALGTRDGGGATANSNFSGLQDVTGIWSRVLTAQEITDLYNSGSGLDYDGLTPDPPDPPSNLEADAINNGAIDIFWDDNSIDEDEFKIERSTTGGGVGFSEIATVGQNVTTYLDTGLSGNTQYFYRVRASNAIGDSAYTAEADATTDADPVGAQTLLYQLKSHWSFEESGTSTVRVDDESSNDLTPRAGGTPQDASGLIGAAVDCNEQGLETADGTPFSFGNHDFTVALWVNTSDWSDGGSLQRLLASKFNGNLNSREWQVDWVAATNRLRFLIRNRADTTEHIILAGSYGNVTPHVDEWILIVAWHDGENDTINIQINDGTVDTLSSVVGGIQTANTSVKTGIGTRDGGGAAGNNNFNGSIDQTAIWCRVLTSAERTALYNSGAGLAYSQFQGGALPLFDNFQMQTALWKNDGFSGTVHQKSADGNVSGYVRQTMITKDESALVSADQETFVRYLRNYYTIPPQFFHQYRARVDFAAGKTFNREDGFRYYGRVYKDDQTVEVDGPCVVNSLIPHSYIHPDEDFANEIFTFSGAIPGMNSFSVKFLWMPTFSFADLGDTDLELARVQLDANNYVALKLLAGNRFQREYNRNDVYGPHDPQIQLEKVVASTQADTVEVSGLYYGNTITDPTIEAQDDYLVVTMTHNAGFGLGLRVERNGIVGENKSNADKTAFGSGVADFQYTGVGYFGPPQLLSKDTNVGRVTRKLPTRNARVLNHVYGRTTKPVLSGEDDPMNGQIVRICPSERQRTLTGRIVVVSGLIGGSSPRLGTGSESSPTRQSVRKPGTGIGRTGSRPTQTTLLKQTQRLRTTMTWLVSF